MAVGLTGNALKIIAAIAMLCDHAGLMLFPQLSLLRIIGRLAFPIFAYMIAEGALYTKNRRRYLWGMLLLALLCQGVYFVTEGSLYMGVLCTFSLSLVTIYVTDGVLARKNALWGVLFALWAAFLCAVFLIAPRYLSGFYVDYGFFGMMLPVAVYFARGRGEKLFFAAVVLSLLCARVGGIQWYSLLALPLLALYNGKRGRRGLKCFFYIFYPAHLAILWLIQQII